MYAILQEARKGRRLGIKYLALIDKTKVPGQYWTSDNADLIFRFKSQKAAISRALKLHNNAKVMTYEEAVEIIKDQKHQIETHKK